MTCNYTCKICMRSTWMPIVILVESAPLSSISTNKWGCKYQGTDQALQALSSSHSK